MASSRPLLVNDDDDENSILDLEDGGEKSIKPTHSPFRNFLSSSKGFLFSLFFALLPSFIQPLLRRHTISKPEPSVAKPERNNALEYLTGVRGVASVIVFIYHWTHGLFHDSMDHAYGDTNTNSDGSPSSNSELHNHILQLPPLRLLYAAEAMVALFFIVSGYVLSYRPIQDMNVKPATNKSTTTLSSLAFRRFPRLFLPALALVLLAFLAQLTGALKTPTTTLLTFLHSFLITGIWTWTTFPDNTWSLSPHLWTVPTEFRCSMVLFALLLTVSQRTLLVRFGIEVGVVGWCMGAGRWDVALFVAGAVMAELRVRREVRLQAREMERTGEEENRNWQCTMWKSIRTTALLSTLITGLLLACYPPIPPSLDTPIFGPLSHLTSSRSESRRTIYAISALLILSSLDNLPGLQKIFNTRIVQYMGRISYALYLVHGLLIRVVGQRVLDGVWKAAAGGGWGAGDGVKFGIASAVVVPVVVWGADLFERGVERRCVVWARRL
ncbi:hypothetical protein LHYA1_G003516 [Lachnellula hyalina]|uniref:Acyltransferase 3 domain-containing protein n=1 Tax=Lachnellula hyalina TaxID=1316788 RepID=A0A8H8R5M7_9HELO|nr:uncharacterized protein LHYA1_G003516 [Lachnellula hyalina]TVY27975.1 hypothetical protein LHYA1_G003516 [Lachnellula hyalina]